MTKGSQNISAVIITFNEEGNLERCLRSLEGVFDEIIIIDSGSTDKTVEIASRFGIDPIYNKFLGFGDQKRFAVQSARNDYVFSIDADEELSPELKNSILRIENVYDQDVYLINRISCLGGEWIKHSGWYPDWLIRLWNRKKGNWNQDLVHESIKMDKGIKAKRLSGLLLHYSIGSLADHLMRTSNYASLKVKGKKRKNKPGFLAHVLKGKYKTFKVIFFKLGFIDGYKGFQIAIVSGLGYLMQYAAGKRAFQLDNSRKNICFVNTTPFWGGGENWHKNAATFLKHKGIEVFAIASPVSPLSVKLENEKIPVFPIKVKGLSFMNPIKIRRLMRYFQQNNIQKVIINGSADLKCGGLAAWLAGVPDIIYRRGIAKAPKHNAINAFYFTSVVTRFLANSKDTLSLLLDWMELPINKFNHRIIHNGIDIQSYAEDSILEPESDPIIIGNAGRLTTQKGHDLLIGIASILKAEGLNFKLKIAGSGPEEKGIKKIIEENRLGNQVELFGFIEDTPAFMKDIDIFVSTARFEGFGYVLVEAMACGKPVVAFDVSSNPEIVEKDVVGLLVKPFDKQLFADAILKLSSNKELRREFGKEGRRRVEKMFDQEKQMKKIEAFLFTRGQDKAPN